MSALHVAHTLLLAVIVSLSVASIARAENETPGGGSVVLISAEPSLVVRGWLSQPHNIKTTHA